MVCGCCDKDAVCVCDKVVCEEVVCEDAEAGSGGGRYRSKNKNPTQFCGEKKTIVGKDSTCF
jgi:hypothetical protein